MNPTPKDSQGHEPDSSIPPWEQPGAVRRDCAPHRGELLWHLGRASVVAAWLSLIFCCVPALISFPWGLVIWHLAEHDLRLMAQGRMDPAGKSETEKALLNARVATWLSSFTLGGVPALAFVFLREL